MIDDIYEALQYHAEFLPTDSDEWAFHHRVAIGKIASGIRKLLGGVEISETDKRIILEELEAQEKEFWI